MYPGKALMEGMNKNLIIYKFRKMKQQRFAFDEINKVFAETYTKNVIQVPKKNINAGANVATSPYAKLANQKWRIVYCDQE